MHMKTIVMMLLGMAGSLPTSGAMLPADTGSAAASQAASTALPVRVIHELDTTWTFSYNDLQPVSREMHRIDIVYPSKDIDGADVELSGQVVIPTEVYNGEQPCDGILLYNHFSTMAKTDVPTRGYAQGIDYVMTTPLKPNWIVVTSDFLGFGITEDRDQVYCFNDINGQASIDCLLAARQLLSQEHRLAFKAFRLNSARRACRFGCCGIDGNGEGSGAPRSAGARDGPAGRQQQNRRQNQGQACPAAFLVCHDLG